MAYRRDGELEHRAVLEYLIQVPANRIGFTALTLPQLKIMQEVVTLAVFVPFSILYMKQPIRLNYLWAFLCLRKNYAFGIQKKFQNRHRYRVPP